MLRLKKKLLEVENAMLKQKLINARLKDGIARLEDEVSRLQVSKRIRTKIKIRSKV